MSDRLLSGFQALQLLALGPCVFILMFLCLTARKPSQAVVPALFFLSLASSFCLPLLDVFSPHPNASKLLMLGQSMTPALIFLLVVQFATGRIPAWFYWAILAVPLVGGSTIITMSVVANVETCVWGGTVCLTPVELEQLYSVFSSCFTLLLTVVVFHRVERAENPSPTLQKTINALVTALIMLNVALLGVELCRLKGVVSYERAALAITVIRIGFIYLVLTSIFRVFDRKVEIAFERMPTLTPAGPSDREQELSAKIRAAMTEHKIYRTMDLSREKLAKHLAVTEHALSRAVNICFAQSISTLINQYRVEEAQARLAQETTAITTIAFEVGFNSIPSFNRVFKQVTGLSPSAYRAEHQTLAEA